MLFNLSTVRRFNRVDRIPCVTWLYVSHLKPLCKSSIDKSIHTVAALDNKYRHSTLTRNGHGSAVVSALGFERSGPGFDFRRPWSDFSSTQQNRRIISSTPAATSTAGNYNYHGQHIPPPQYNRNIRWMSGLQLTVLLPTPLFHRTPWKNKRSRHKMLLFYLVAASFRSTFRIWNSKNLRLRI